MSDRLSPGNTKAARLCERGGFREAFGAGSEDTLILGWLPHRYEVKCLPTAARVVLFRETRSRALRRRRQAAGLTRRYPRSQRGSGTRPRYKIFLRNTSSVRMNFGTQEERGIQGGVVGSGD